MKRRTFLKISLPFVIAGDLAAQAANRETPIVSFGVIADPQYADQDPRGNRHYRQSIQKLKDSIKDLNERSLDFVVTLGDVIEEDYASFEKIMPIYGEMKAPYRVVLGNHDFDVAEADKSRVQGALRLRKTYYSESIKGWRFIYLDSTEVSLFRYPKDHPRHLEAQKCFEEVKRKKELQAYEWNGGVSQEQIEWFKNELAAAEKAQQAVIIFNHNPVYPKGDHNLWNAEEVVGIISQNKHVVAYMNGHYHAGHYVENAGCHYVNFKGMVETKDTTAYAVVECFSDRIEIDGFGVEPDRKLFM